MIGVITDVQKSLTALGYGNMMYIEPISICNGQRITYYH